MARAPPRDVTAKPNTKRKHHHQYHDDSEESEPPSKRKRKIQHDFEIEDRKPRAKKSVSRKQSNIGDQGHTKKKSKIIATATHTPKASIKKKSSSGKKTPKKSKTHPEADFDQVDETPTQTPKASIKKKTSSGKKTPKKSKTHPEADFDQVDETHRTPVASIRKKSPGTSKSKVSLGSSKKSPKPKKTEEYSSSDSGVPKKPLKKKTPPKTRVPKSDEKKTKSSQKEKPNSKPTPVESGTESSDRDSQKNPARGRKSKTPEPDPEVKRKGISKEKQKRPETIEISSDTASTQVIVEKKKIKKENNDCLSDNDSGGPTEEVKRKGKSKKTSTKKPEKFQVSMPRDNVARMPEEEFVEEMPPIGTVVDWMRNDSVSNPEKSKIYSKIRRLTVEYESLGKNVSKPPQQDKTTHDQDDYSPPEENDFAIASDGEFHGEDETKSAIKDNNVPLGSKKKSKMAKSETIIPISSQNDNDNTYQSKEDKRQNDSVIRLVTKEKTKELSRERLMHLKEDIEAELQNLANKDEEEEEEEEAGEEQEEEEQDETEESWSERDEIEEDEEEEGEEEDKQEKDEEEEENEDKEEVEEEETEDKTRGVLSFGNESAEANKAMATSTTPNSLKVIQKSDETSPRKEEEQITTESKVSNDSVVSDVEVPSETKPESDERDPNKDEENKPDEESGQ